MPELVSWWNALPDGVHFLGMAALDALPPVARLVRFAFGLLGWTLFEDGSVGL